MKTLTDNGIMAITQLKKGEVLCRTCLKTNAFYNIFSYMQNNKLLSDLIMECVPIEVKADDAFTKYMCRKCVMQIKRVCEFKATIIESDRILHDDYQNNIKDLERSEVNGDLKKEEITTVKILESDTSQGERNNLPYHVLDELLGDKDYTPDFTSSSIKYECDNKSDISVVPQQDSAENLHDNPSYDCNSEKNKLIEGSIVQETNQICLSNDNKLLDIVKNINEESDSCNPYDGSDFEDSNAAVEDNSKCSIQAENLDKFDATKALLLENSDYEKVLKSGLKKECAAVFCKICNKKFRYRYISVHMRVHNGDKPFKCDECNKGFPRAFNLKQHKLIHSNSKLSCQDCGKTFSTTTLLYSHRATHSNDRPYKCSICNKAFKLKRGLNQHSLTHEGRKEICELCGKSFRCKGTLSKHIATHNTCKNFVCSICNKAFNTKNLLHTHIRRHSEEKLHVCSECGKSFGCRSVLRCHMRIHTGSKPYKCKICGKEFRQNNILSRHMRTHTGESPYPCTLCSLRFKYTHHLQNHMKIHMNNTAGEGSEDAVQE